MTHDYCPTAAAPRWTSVISHLNLVIHWSLVIGHWSFRVRSFIAFWASRLLAHGEFNKAGRSADFPVGSIAGTFHGSEEFCSSHSVTHFCGLESPRPLGFATHHPGGMGDNSPTFQRWDRDRQRVKVPKGRLKLCAQSAVPSGLVARRTAVPNVETLSYSRKSLRDKDSRGFCRWLQGSIPGGIGLESPRSVLESTVLLASLALFCLCPSAAQAHQLSDSFLILEVTNAQIIGHWDIAVKDLLHARGIDPLDQKLTDKRSWDPEYEMKAAAVLSHLKLQIDGTPVEIKPVDYSTEVYNDGPYAALYFEIALPKNPRLLQVEYRLFFGTDPSHRGLMRLRTGANTLSAVFSPSQPTQQFDLRKLTNTERFFDVIRLGVWH